MSLNARQLVSALGSGPGLPEVAATAGVTVQEAEGLWETIIRGKVPPASAALVGRVGAAVEIIRDSYGVPHVYAQHERDVFFGLGFAMAQDRLWLMDYMRRKASGRLAEILGASYVDQDYTFRVLDFGTICAREYALLADRWRQVVDGMADGINRAIGQTADNLPIEFDLLGYRPEPWAPVDILVGLRYQWWGLSGRLAQITTATILERELGDRLTAFQKAERDNLYIVPDGQNVAATSGDPASPRDSLHLGDQPFGSNNWVIAGSRTRSGKPLLANDPHYSYAHGHGLFYPCHLNGAGHGEAGFVFIGTPGMMTGVNDRIAWGFTNNGTTIRDLYAEELDPADPSRYRVGDGWAKISTRAVEIAVKGQESVHKVVRSTAHGPIVNDIVPKIGSDDPPLALRWVGFEQIDDVRALIGLNTAANWQEFRSALSHWACSVTNFIYADVDDHIGYQMSARIPLREAATRGVRPAWHPDHEWQGYVPFDGNPRIEDPPVGIIATANNRPVALGYRWPLYGAHAGGTRQARILQILTAKTDHDVADFRRMQYDSKSLIAEEVTPRVVAALQRTSDAQLREVAALLAAWDFTARVNLVAPTIFEMFMHRWTPAYAAATLPDQPAVRAAAGHAAHRALVGEESVLDDGRLAALVVATMHDALHALSEKFGDDPTTWRWGQVHYLAWPHPLDHLGHLGALLNGPKLPCGGTGNVINCVAPSSSVPFVAASGPTYRLIADLANPDSVLINAHCPTSGHPGSPHYADSMRDWANGNYQTLNRIRALVELEAEGTTVIRPG
ncbi:MAG TPA: penicillin acylase family protein [Chloroflexota bacterium]|nr:penicillin acylase family protein [Chloroflexota bacterium]